MGPMFRAAVTIHCVKRLLTATLMKADARRLMAIEMFEQSHIAPSHRRLPHLSWTTSFSLLLDLLIGAGKTRYLNTRPHARSHREVFVRTVAFVYYTCSGSSPL